MLPILLSGMIGCTCERTESTVEALGGAPPWGVVAQSRPKRDGMLWIPPGVLKAGTKPGLLPRVADQEMPGVALEMGGFFIDRFNHPDEPGAIPTTGLTRDEARTVCEEQDKRLCTELEWERACKGPNNTTYEYGNEYDDAACGMSMGDALAPNGVNTRCVAEFGVRDMHGSAFNWTSSDWGRGSKGGRVSVRGGTGAEGELIGRCANARAYKPSRSDPRIGVRCCAGEVNPHEVELAVAKGRGLTWRPKEDGTAARLAALAPESIQERVRALPAGFHFAVDRVWEWRPIGNELLVIGGGCAHPPGRKACGLVVARLEGEGAERLAFVSTDWWIPTVGEHDSPRIVFLYGGDRGGAYRKLVVYKWGRVVEGAKQRKRAGVYHSR